MSTQTSFDLTGLSRAIQARDCRYHLALYADDAQVEILDAQPGTPLQVLKGKPAIGEWLDSMSSSAVHYQLRDAVVHPDHVTYTEECRYADGSRVLFECRAEVRRGQIRRAAVRVVHIGRDEARPAVPARRTLQNLPGNFLG